jgi:hypothetical protein
MRVVGYELWVTGYELQVTSCRVQGAGSKGKNHSIHLIRWIIVQTVWGYGLQVANGGRVRKELRVASYKLQVAGSIEGNHSLHLIR